MALDKLLPPSVACWLLGVSLLCAACGSPGTSHSTPTQQVEEVASDVPSPGPRDGPRSPSAPAGISIAETEIEIIEQFREPGFSVVTDIEGHLFLVYSDSHFRMRIHDLDLRTERVAEYVLPRACGHFHVDAVDRVSYQPCNEQALARGQNVLRAAGAVRTISFDGSDIPPDDEALRPPARPLRWIHRLREGAFCFQPLDDLSLFSGYDVHPRCSIGGRTHRLPVPDHFTAAQFRPRSPRGGFQLLGVTPDGTFLVIVAYQREGQAPQFLLYDVGERPVYRARWSFRTGESPYDFVGFARDSSSAVFEPSGENETSRYIHRRIPDGVVSPVQRPLLLDDGQWLIAEGPPEGGRIWRASGRDFFVGRRCPECPIVAAPVSGL